MRKFIKDSSRGSVHSGRYMKEPLTRRCACGESSHLRPAGSGSREQDPVEWRHSILSNLEGAYWTIMAAPIIIEAYAVWRHAWDDMLGRDAMWGGDGTKATLSAVVIVQSPQRASLPRDGTIRLQLLRQQRGLHATPIAATPQDTET